MRMLRTRFYADPQGRFVHDVILESCTRFPHKTAIIDSSVTVTKTPAATSRTPNTRSWSRNSPVDWSPPA